MRKLALDTKLDANKVAMTVEIEATRKNAKRFALPNMRPVYRRAISQPVLAAINPVWDAAEVPSAYG
jgi:hypothetical protein